VLVVAWTRINSPIPTYRCLLLSSARVLRQLRQREERQRRKRLSHSLFLLRYALRFTSVTGRGRLRSRARATETLPPKERKREKKKKKKKKKKLGLCTSVRKKGEGRKSYVSLMPGGDSHLISASTTSFRILRKSLILAPSRRSCCAEGTSPLGGAYPRVIAPLFAPNLHLYNFVHRVSPQSARVDAAPRRFQLSGKLDCKPSSKLDRHARPRSPVSVSFQHQIVPLIDSKTSIAPRRTLSVTPLSILSVAATRVALADALLRPRRRHRRRTPPHHRRAIVLVHLLVPHHVAAM
jgi:hypothetical protein